MEEARGAMEETSGIVNGVELEGEGIKRRVGMVRWSEWAEERRAERGFYNRESRGRGQDEAGD